MQEGDVNPKSSRSWGFIARVLLKAGLLLVLLNLAAAIVGPQPLWSRFTLYNSVVPGRKRLPYGDHPTKSFNITLVDLQTMFASHEIAGAPKQDDEYRVMLVGDSSVWGFFQTPDETITAKLNQMYDKDEGSKNVRFFNLGYPTMSLFKDLLLLEEGMNYEPDLVLWFITLESFPKIRQLDAPLVQWNQEPARSFIDRFELDQANTDERFLDQSLWDRTVLGSRKVIADQFRFQVYGMMWAATGVDHVIPEKPAVRAVDLPQGAAYHEYDHGDLAQSDLAFDMIEAGMVMAGEVPVILINEPIFIQTGRDGEIRYNFYYPRWAYDLYRELLNHMSRERGWQLIDLWDFLPPSEFTDAGIHTTDNGAEAIAEALLVSIPLAAAP